MARFASNPGPAHWEAIKRIFRYLAGTCDLWLLYGEARRTLVVLRFAKRCPTWTRIVWMQPLMT
jgi:hypothetical protein